MRTRTRWVSAVPGVLSLMLALAVVGCSGTAPSPLDPRTSDAARIAELGWAMIGIATVVCVVVFAALLVALRVRPAEAEWRQSQPTGTGDQASRVLPDRANARAERVVMIAGMVVP